MQMQTGLNVANLCGDQSYSFYVYLLEREQFWNRDKKHFESVLHTFWDQSSTIQLILW